MSDNPLHVQVAEALGWIECRDRGDGLWMGINPIGLIPPVVEVPRFDISWCATGKLIERFRFQIGPEDGLWYATTNDLKRETKAKTPVAAVAKLIVELHKEGKLPV